MFTFEILGKETCSKGLETITLAKLLPRKL